MGTLRQEDVEQEDDKRSAGVVTAATAASGPLCPPLRPETEDMRPGAHDQQADGVSAVPGLQQSVKYCCRGGDKIPALELSSCDKHVGGERLWRCGQAELSLL